MRVNTKLNGFRNVAKSEFLATKFAMKASWSWQRCPQGRFAGLNGVPRRCQRPSAPHPLPCLPARWARGALDSSMTCGLEQLPIKLDRQLLWFFSFGAFCCAEPVSISAQNAPGAQGSDTAWELIVRYFETER